MIQTIPTAAIMILFLSLRHLVFEFVSTNLIKSGEIRISNFTNARTAKYTLCVYSKAGPSDPDLYSMFIAG